MHRLAFEGRGIARQIMPERDRLGLHAPGVGRNDGVGRLRGQRQQRLARAHQFLEGGKEIVAGDQALGGRADILTASPRMQPADIGAADRHQILFHPEIVARSPRARCIARGIDAIDGIENLRSKRLRNNAPFDDHDRGSLVDLGKPEKAVAGSGRAGDCKADRQHHDCGPNQASARPQEKPP
jgi:hypothetical protein